MRLALAPEQVERLDEYREPPESAIIEPETKDSLWGRIRKVFRRPTS